MEQDLRVANIWFDLTLRSLRPGLLDQMQSDLKKALQKDEPESEAGKKSA